MFAFLFVTTAQLLYCSIVTSDVYASGAIAKSVQLPYESVAICNLNDYGLKCNDKIHKEV